MGLAYDIGHHELVLFGGYAAFGNDSKDMRDTWTWDGSTWTQHHPTASPPPTYGMSMVYDEARDDVVLFGGGNDHYVSNQTWTWDGTDWALRHPSKSPPGEIGGAMAYDPVRQEVVLLTGDFYSPGTTWTWDGTDWTEQHPSTTPPARTFPAGAFDEVDGTFVVFGGSWSCGELGCPRNDMWAWDGTDWTEEHPAHRPSARSAAGMAFDPVVGGLVLFGRGASDDPRSTWTWDGADWASTRPLPSPQPRSGSGMVYDPGLVKVLLFGGITVTDGSNLHSFNDLWAWDGTSWIRIG
jgi:hypothetical protein